MAEWVQLWAGGIGFVVIAYFLYEGFVRIGAR